MQIDGYFKDVDVPKISIKEEIDFFFSAYRTMFKIDWDIYVNNYSFTFSIKKLG